ncbi:MAG: VOC family protein [Solirubrobacterales bacterium]|nr:VOC family protein [Solirubrobacterales bacterium]
MTEPQLRLPRLRQAVVAAQDLDDVAEALSAELDLGQPYHDPAVEYFGLRNAVFALGETFLEVVSPVRDEAPAARLLERRGGDCGYMVMLQVDDVAAARRRAQAAGVREVFEVAVDDMEEVHLHPADMRGAIVSLSQPKPAASWRWGGPDWNERAARVRVTGATIAVGDPDVVGGLWRRVAGPLPQLSFIADEDERGLVEIALTGPPPGREQFELAGVRFVFDEEAQ